MASDQQPTFKHLFFGWMEAEARRWINPDGSEGGIVAVDASVHASVKLGVTVEVGPRASIGDGAFIGDGDWFLTVGPQGSRNAMALAVCSLKHGLRWWIGCQEGISTDTLRTRIENEHGSNAHADDYLHLIRFVETHPGLARWKAKNELKEAA